ncbi:TPA: hypothetical protein ACNICF_001517 [Proteus mirabilis]
MRKGATKIKACATVGLSIRTFQRWTQNSGEVTSNMRQQPRQHEPHNKLSEAERQQILDTCNTRHFYLTLFRYGNDGTVICTS